MTVSPICAILLLIMISSVSASIGFGLCAVFYAGKTDKHISCSTCKHSKRGELDVHNSNCAKCLCEGAFMGYERKGAKKK